MPLFLVMKRQYAFTVIELVVVVAVTAIFAVAVFPRFREKSDFEQAGYRAQVVAVLQYARKTAIASRRYVCVESSSANKTISLKMDPNLPETVAGAGSVSCSQSLSLPGGSSNTTTAPSSVTKLAASSALFYFDPLGQAVSAPGTTAKISIANDGQDIVVEMTGYVY